MELRLGVLALVALAVMAQNPPAGEAPGIFSLEKEALIGVRIAEGVRKDATVMESVAAREYIQQIGQNLAAQMPASGLTYTFELVAESEGLMHEPAVAPGGHIFVPAPLFLSVESESEFAGVLAHSVAHAAGRHSVRLVQPGPVTPPSKIPLMVVIHLRNSIVPLGYVEPLREFELEADRLAMQAMARAGYEPAALCRYATRMQGADAQDPHAPIPPRQARLANLEQALATLAPNERTSNSGEFEKIRRELRALLARTPPRPSLR